MNLDDDCISAGAVHALRARTPLEAQRDDEHRSSLHSAVRAESRRLHRRAAQRRIGGLAAALLGAAVIVGAVIRSAASVTATSDRMITFDLYEPSAMRVSVVGEFNGWDASATPMSRTATGQWRASVDVPPGRYTYSFVVNDSVWIADPVAPRSPERFYGNSKSVLVVASLQ
jgi:hypothetical protein